MYGGGVQTAPGVPGSFPLPNPGAPGNVYAQQAKMHPAAAAARSRSVMGGRPAGKGK